MAGREDGKNSCSQFSMKLMWLDVTQMLMLKT